MAIKLIEKKNRKPGSGRIKGSKTRPDAPRMVRARLRREKLEREKKLISSSPHIIPAKVAAEITSTANAAPPIIEARPDTELFGEIKLPHENQPRIKTELPETDNENNSERQENGNQSGDTGLPPETEEKPPAGSPEDQRGFATIVWDSIVGLCATFFGAFWFPRKVGRNAQGNEIPYDEREMVISAFCKYFESIGLKVLSPLQELFCVIGAYCLPRLRLTFEVIQLKFRKKPKPAPPQPPNDARMPGNDSPSAPKPPETVAPEMQGISTLDLAAMDAIKKQSSGR